MKKGAPDVYYELHEVFYDDHGKTTNWTKNPATVYGETVDELIGCLERMLINAKRSKDDVIDYDSKPESDELECE